MAVETPAGDVERSIRRFYDMEKELKEATARVAEVEKETAARIIRVEMEANERVGSAEREASRLQGHVDVLTAQKAKDDAELGRLRSMLAETDLAIREVAVHFTDCMEKLRVGGYRQAGSKKVEFKDAAGDPASINGLRAVEIEVAGAIAHAPEPTATDLGKRFGANGRPSADPLPRPSLLRELREASGRVVADLRSEQR